MYIYAFPVQQLLAVVGLASLPVLLYGVVALAATVPLAVVSWLLVEKPALSLKWPTRRTATVQTASTGPS